MDPNIPASQEENNTPQTGVPTPIPPVNPNPQPEPIIMPPPQPVAPIVSEVGTTDQPPAPSIPPTPQAPPEPVKKSSPVFVIALILLLIAIAALGGYVLWTKYLNKSSTKVAPTPIAIESPSPTPDPTAGWKTYVNTKYFYSLKYPNDYKVGINGMDREGLNLETLDSLVIYLPDSERVIENFAISLISTNPININELIQKHIDKVTKPQLTEASKASLEKDMGSSIVDPTIQEPLQQITVGGLPAYAYVIKSNFVDDGGAEYVVPIQTRKYIWLTRNKDVFLISYTDSAPTNNILSTFKFNDTPSSSSSSPSASPVAR